ncbi:MAG: V-type ATP synthase subunit I [Brevinematia bacterium]
MFFPERMRKVDIFILNHHKEAVKRELLKFGEFESINLSENKLKEFFFFKKIPVEERIVKLKELEKRVDYLHSMVKNFWEKIETEESKTFTILKEEEIESTLAGIENKINDLNKKLEDVKKRKVEEELRLRKNFFLSQINLDLSEYENLKFFGIYFGSIPFINKQALVNALKDFSCELRFLGEIGKEAVLLLIYPKKFSEKIESVLKNAYFKDFGFPEANDKKEGFLKLGLSVIGLQDEEIWYESKIKETLRVSIPVFDVLTESIRYYLALARLEREMASSRDVALISCWIPDRKLERLKSVIESVTDKKCVITSIPDYEAMGKEGMTPPTMLSNPSFLKPFEGLVLNFGVPSYREVDPTTLVAFSYVLMYGVMFGDLGQGLVLFLIGLLGLFVKRFSYIRAFAKIICYVGLSSAFFGILYGELFGFDHIIRTIWLKPLTHIMEILLFAIGFGVWMVSLGIVINIINCIRERNFGRLLFSSMGIPGMGFYWSFLSILVLGVMKKFSGWMLYIPAFFLVLIAFEKPLDRLFFKHANEEEVSLNPIMIIVEVVEAVLTFLTNTISFMRVGAFALNHQALMIAVFIIAAMFKNSIIEWIVILFGNLFVIGFEGFIVSIQVLRLEYYEFFMKFFRGGGKAFEGLKR